MIAVRILSEFDLGVRQAVELGAAINFASFLRFWAVAARWNSSLAPQGPRNRSLPSPRMRFRCANSISTFLRSLQDIA